LAKLKTKVSGPPQIAGPNDAEPKAEG
jgi:hypothetical protein